MELFITLFKIQKIFYMTRRMLFISNMYPSEISPSFGTFVKTNEEQLMEMGCFDIEKSVIDRQSNGVLDKAYLYMTYIFDVMYKLIFKEFDVIYAHYLTHTTIPLLMWPFYSGKLVINVHGDDLVGKTLAHRLMQICNKHLLVRATLIVVPSPLFKKILMDKFPFIISDKVIVNYSGGVRYGEFKTARVVHDMDEIVVGYCSRIDEGKLWGLLLNSIKKVENKLREKKVIFYFYGSGNQLPSFYRNIEELNIADLVKYRGVFKIHQAPTIYSQFSHFIFPTSRESLGLVALEGMASGCITMCSNIEPITSLCENGVIYFDNTVDSLSSALLSAISMTSRDKQELINSAKKISSRYDYNEVKRKLWEAINECFN
ncbi:glycosyltransferase family 4 protein [Vibrio cholerae]|uniref:glycosyltransferase family 4 protein n=1 Tax=Vibrio cholerae TaxID=666 RepID=UPI00115A9A46|nr:glycosyltransferase family 4 protein [Vibrio cholerae]TQP71396.1 glycosyltransferase family 4 protein [Vibrio cholerae]